MFQKIFIEKSIVHHKKTNDILSRLNCEINSKKVQLIDSYTNYFGRVKKPYLQKRNQLNLYLAQKKGRVVKEAPNAYGLSGEPHYYFIHQYNCLYECSYCYLQGYFHSPDIVFFVNHDEIQNKMTQIYQEYKSSQKMIWFHAGEFSDSLALSHITGELEDYWSWFSKHQRAYLELRTKSANIKEILKLPPLKNFITSFSLSPQKKIKEHDLKTPPLKVRVQALSKLKQAGHKIAAHLDPVIYSNSYKDEYNELFNFLEENDLLSNFEYISVGVVRFTKDVFAQVKRNYPGSSFLKDNLISTKDGLVRYSRPLRNHILQSIKNELVNRNFEEEKIYLCMEEL